LWIAFIAPTVSGARARILSGPMSQESPTAAVRAASPADAAACARIYAPYVTDTAISFELEPPGETEMRARIEAACATHAWFVLEDGGAIAGYAYGAPLHRRPAYRWSCEVSVYVELSRRRTGAGRALYAALFEGLAARGFRTVVAGMTLPNEPSAGLHRTMGFEPIGTYRNIGYKLGRWHDVAYLQRELADPGNPPAEPR
jgi:phosphinothricin acetyltransferase